MKDGLYIETGLWVLPWGFPIPTQYREIVENANILGLPQNVQHMVG